MEPILTLDLSDSPARLRVVSFEDDAIKIWSESRVDLEYSPEQILSESNVTQREDGQEQGDYNPSSYDPTTNESSPPEAADVVEAPKSEAPRDPHGYFVSQLTEAIAKLDPVWTSSALLVAPESYHSINLELPFKDDKHVIKVLALEAQDRLPFDIEEFFFDHKVLGVRPDQQFDVHVAFTRKDEISELLTRCQQAGLDPIAISTVPCMLEGQILADPSRFAQHSAFLAFHGDRAYLAFRVAGEFKSDRVFKYKDLTIEEIVSEVKRSLGGVEARYSVKFAELWIYTSPSEPKTSTGEVAPSNVSIASLPALAEKELAKSLKIFVSSIETVQNQGNLLADWFTTFYHDGKTAKLLVNFRSGQFSQTLRWGALWKITKSALPYFLMLVVTFTAILIACYFIREQEINNLQQGVINQVQPLLGNTKLVPGQVVKSIQIANDTIEKQLKDLGSPSKFSPLDVLSEVTKDFSSIKDVSITSVNIRGTQLTVAGTSSNYENVDAIEKVLQSKRTLYCRPSKQVSGTSTRQFTFTVTLCD